MSSGNIILDSLIKIRKGFLIEFIASAIVSTSVYLIFYTSIFHYIVRVFTGNVTRIIELVTILGAVFLVINAIALIYQYQGFKGLERVIQKAIWGEIGAILAVVGGIISLFSPFIGFVLTFTGFGIVGTATFDIGDYYHNGLTKAGGIMIIIP